MSLPISSFLSNYLNSYLSYSSFFFQFSSPSVSEQISLVLTKHTVKNWDDYEAFLPRHNKFKQGHLHDPFMPAEEVRQKLDQIRGHLVWMPLDFLKDAPMAEKGLQVNAYTESIYT